MRKLLTLIALALALALSARAADAQTSLTADRIYLGATGCALRTGAGVPTGGTACDFYFDTATGHVWVNHAGTWIDISTRTPTFQSVTATTKLTTPLIDTATGPLALAPASGAIVPLTNLGASFGTPTQKFLALHLGELWAESLVAQDVLATIGGRVIVAPTTMLTADLSTSATTLTVKANTLQNGDSVFLQSAPGGVPQMEWMTVTSAASGTSGAYTYTVTRNVDGSGANAWLGGDAVVDTGTVGKGFIDLYALSGVLTGFGPTIVGNVRTGSAFNAYAPRWAIGNLRDVGYGHTGFDFFGMAAGNRNGAYWYVDDTNGLVMAGPLGTRVQITPAGVATFFGDGGGVTNINGGNLTTGSITADKIAADTITADKIAAGAVTASELAAGSVTSAKLASGTGSNVVRNSECRASSADWSLFDGTGLGATLGFSPGAFWSINGEPGVCYWFVTGTPANGTSTIAYYTPSGALGFPVVAGRAYEGSVYLGSAAGSGPLPPAPFVALTFMDVGGGALSSVPGNACSVTAGADLNTTWCRSGIIALAPAGARYVRLAVVQNYIGTTGNPYTTTVRWFLGEAKPNQTELSEWSPAGMTEIIGGVIKTDTLDARVIQANAITADKIAAGAITAGKIAADSITAAQIATGAITSDELAAGAITAGKIAADSITAAQIATGAITSDELAAGAVTAGKIAAGSITADRMNVTALSAITANLGAVNAGSLTAVAITGGTIDGTTIRGVNISASSSITGANISSSTMIAGSVTLDGNGMTVAGGDGGGSARIKLGTVQLWGSNSGGLLVSDGGFDIQAIRAHQNVDFEKLLHVYQNITADGTVSSGGSLLTNSNMGFQGGGTPTLYWLGGGLPPLANGGTQAYIDTNCGCLARLASSARYKENFRRWAPDDPFALLSVPLYRFDFKPDAVHPNPVKNHVGLTVEDLYKVAPDAVALDREGRPDGIQDDTLHAYFLAAMRAAEAQILELQKKVAALETAARRKDHP